MQRLLDCVGKIPTARFGHTIVMVSPVKVVLFGGAVGDTKNFQFTNDTYVLNLMTKIWLKLDSKIYSFYKTAEILFFITIMFKFFCQFDSWKKYF